MYIQRARLLLGSLVWSVLAYISINLVPGCIAQTASTNTAVNQFASAFSSGHVVQQIQLNGIATWTAGSLVD